MREERKDVCCFEHFTSFKRFSPSPGQSWEQCFKLCPSWPNCLSNICGIRKQFLFCFSTAADYWQSPWLALWLHNARDAGDNNFINTSLWAANQKPWLSKWPNQKAGNCHQTHWIHHASGQKTSITLLVSMSRVNTCHDPLIGQLLNWRPLIGSMFPANVRILIWPFDHWHSDLRRK